MARRFPVGLTLSVAIAAVILIGLGNWQWRRLGEKEAFLAGLNRQIEAAPIPLPLLPEPLTRVTISGSFLPQSLPVHATLQEGRPGKSLGGLGFWWLTPLQTADGRIVLVNRGFVPAGRDNRPVAPETPAGEQKIIGLVREPDHGNAFLPSDDIAKQDFFRRDPSLLASAIGQELAPIGKLAPFTIDAERSGSAIQPPVGLDVRELIDQIPNNHLSYAFTWWGLAVTLFAVYAAYLISDWRKRQPQS